TRVLSKRHSDAQVFAAAAMLDGSFVELMNGQGKTYALALAAATRAATGESVEIITTREEHAHETFELLKPLYEALGIQAAVVDRELTLQERQAAYASDITYVCAGQVLHDYLQDRVVLQSETSRPLLALEQLLNPEQARLGQLMLTGLHCAFVHDVDQVLIDDAQRPISVIDGRQENDLHLAHVEALKLARGLSEGVHFTVDPDAWQVSWTEAGERQLELACGPLPGAFQREAWRSSVVLEALVVLHLWQRGVTHTFEEKRLQLTELGAQHFGSGRGSLVALLDLVETGEDSPGVFPQRRMSLPRFFRRYQRLAGCASTLSEVRTELSLSYDLHVLCVPQLAGEAPAFHQRHAYMTREQSQMALTERLRAITDVGEAALVGVRSEVSLEALFSHLVEHGLNVSKVQLSGVGLPIGQELSCAGESGRVTLLPARGFRADRVAEPGRLHVIAAEPSATLRLDRVLFGHAVGSAVGRPLESFVALDDPLLESTRSEFMSYTMQRVAQPSGQLPERILRPFVRRAQKRQERELYDRRQATLNAEESFGAVLAFGGGDH
ncbi:MAG: preprotein translocase subunit SecA, partial [Candidatus Paceibacteria bacterium]